MSELISGLLTQKPSSPAPAVGEIGRYETELKPKKSGDGTWVKIKNAGGDFGSPFKVLKAERKDDYTHPQHGVFHQYSILLEPATNGAAPLPAVSGDKDAAIEKAVIFKAAVRLAGYEVQGGHIKPEAVVDRVQSLVGTLAPILTGAAEGKAPDTDAPVGTGGPTDDEIPFAPSRI